MVLAVRPNQHGFATPMRVDCIERRVPRVELILGSVANVQRKRHDVNIGKLAATGAKANSHIHVGSPLSVSNIETNGVAPALTKDFLDTLQADRTDDTNIRHIKASRQQISQLTFMTSRSTSTSREALQNDVPFTKNPSTILNRQTGAILT